MVASLRFPSVYEEDENKFWNDYYICNRTSCIFSLTLSLLLEQPVIPRGPHIIVKSHHVIASAGSNVTLLCDIRNVRHYYAAWLWKFNGNSTTLDKRYPSPDYSQTEVKFHDRMTMVLDVINASERHSGLYECSIFELMWFDENNITLIVDEKGNCGRVLFGLIQTEITGNILTKFSLRYEPARSGDAATKAFRGTF